jgi:hypothetical protein
MGGLFPISYRKIASFNQCRRQFWFRYVDRRPSDPDEMHPGGIVGLGVHRAMKALCLTGRQEDGESVLKAYLAMPDHEVAGPGTEYHTDAFRMYENGCVAHDSIISENRWAELPADTRYEGGGIEISARIDRADRLDPEHYQLIDWKTGRFESDEAADEQLDIAHITLRRARRLSAETRVTAVGWNLRSGKRRVRALTRDDATGTLDYLVAAAVRMRETEEWEATPSRACNFCEFRLQCEDAYSSNGAPATDKPADGDDLFEPLEPDGDDLLPFD